MRHLTKNTLYRDAADVARYHTKRTIRQQTVGQHSFNMILLLQQVAPDCRKEVLLAAAQHDLPELKTGDVPGPIKRMHPQLGPLLDEIEQGLAPLFHDHGLTPDEDILVKWADRMEGCLWCLEEFQLGNQHLKRTAAKYMSWILESKHPDHPVANCLEADAFTQQVVDLMTDLNITIIVRPYSERGMT